MSDLLSRLISLASGAVSPVEPVLASQYERPPVSAPTAATAPVATVAPRSLEESTREQANPENEIADEAPSVRHAEKREEERVPEEPRRFRVPATPPIGPDEPATDAAPLARDLPQRAFPIERVDNERPPLEVRVQLAASRDAVESVDRPRTIDTSTVREDHSPGVISRPSMPAVAEHIAVTAGESVQPVDVEVTIGHVELRIAAPLQPPAQARRPAHPRVTLDDYLRRRNGDAK